MMDADELINPNPVVHARRRTARRRVRVGSGEGAISSGDGNVSSPREPIDSLEVFEHLRDITDPEHPYSLEQLGVVEEAGVDVDDKKGSVR